MSLLDLINQYGNSAQNPYARPIAVPPQVAPTVASSRPSIVNLIDTLGRNPAVNPYAAQATANASQGLDTNPQIVQISADEAARALAQQGGNPGQAAANAAAPARIAAMQAQAAQQQATAAKAAQQTPPPAAQPQAPAMQQASAEDQPVAEVQAQSSFPSPSDYNADGTQAQAQSADQSAPVGGLIGSLAGAAQQAVSDPSQSKGLLSQLGDMVSGVGSKLKNMSPAASQALIASGLTMLAANDGHHNLAQLAGEGGIAGLNQYQTVTQNQIGNQMARQKMAIDLYDHQIANQVAQQNANSEMWAKTHPLISGGQTMLGPDGSGNMVPIASGGVKAEGSIDQVQPDGSTMTYKTDTTGRIIPGTGMITKNPNVGPPNPEQQKVINEQSTAAANQQQALSRTQQLMAKLSPTMVDPQTGKEVANPAYANVPGGAKASGQNLLSRMTGSLSTGQILRNELQQQTYQDYLATWKPGIGGRLTNTDVGLLQKGMPPENASGETWFNFLKSYATLQQDMADRARRSAAFVSAGNNRGDMSALHHDMTLDGVTYPAGTSYDDVVAGRGGTQAGQSGQNGGNQAIVAKAQAAARAGDTNAQAALKQRGLSW